MEGELLGGEVSVEQVNRHLLEKLDYLILHAESPEVIASLTDSLAKYNASIRNNAIFAPEETPEERQQRQFQEAWGTQQQ